MTRAAAIEAIRRRRVEREAEDADWERRMRAWNRETFGRRW
jgi:hypothetical protein